MQVKITVRVHLHPQDWSNAKKFYENLKEMGIIIYCMWEFKFIELL